MRYTYFASEFSTEEDGKMRKKIILLALLSSILCAVMLIKQPADADTIILKDGRKIEGLILKERGDSYLVEIRIGTITVDKSMIGKIEKLSDEENCVAAGDRYLDSENYNEALAQYKKALKLNPSFRLAKEGIEKIEKSKKLSEEKKQKEIEIRKRELLDKQGLVAKVFGFELKTAGDRIEIASIIAGSQADAKSLKQGDTVIRINDLLVKNEALDKILDYLVNGEGQAYNFIVQRKVELVRKNIIYQKRAVAGVGIFLETSGNNLVIDRLISGEPADKAGLRPSDTIVFIDDKSTAGMSLDEAADLFMGTEFSKLTLVIERNFTLTKPAIIP